MNTAMMEKLGRVATEGRVLPANQPPKEAPKTVEAAAAEIVQFLNQQNGVLIEQQGRNEWTINGVIYDGPGLMRRANILRERAGLPRFMWRSATPVSAPELDKPVAATPEPVATTEIDGLVDIPSTQVEPAPMEAAATLRRIEALAPESLSAGIVKNSPHAIEPNQIDEPIPTIEWVNPCDILIDEGYQRSLSRQSISLIRRIVAGWSWRKFKAPICARTEAGLEAIDGQHTAIAAATHPGVDKIPVLITVSTRAERATAFVAHNRDRLGVTPTQIFASAIVAGDPEAVAVQGMCDKAGVRILKNAPGGAPWKPNQTIAITALQQLYRRQGAPLATQVLKVITAAGCCAPISANHIKAIEALMCDSEYAAFTAKISPLDIADVIRRCERDGNHTAGVLAATHKLAMWKAMTIDYFRKLKSRR